MLTNLYYVYAYNMAESESESKWVQLCCTRVISYHDDAREATFEVTRLINDDQSDCDECFAVGAIPLGSCHEFNQV